jgi:hypothetical protein
MAGPGEAAEQRDGELGFQGGGVACGGEPPVAGVFGVVEEVPAVQVAQQREPGQRGSMFSDGIITSTRAAACSWLTISRSAASTPIPVSALAGWSWRAALVWAVMLPAR